MVGEALEANPIHLQHSVTCKRGENLNYTSLTYIFLLCLFQFFTFLHEILELVSVSVL